MAYSQPEKRKVQVAAFVRAAVEGKSADKIAEAAGISVRSVYSWHRRPIIRKQIEETLNLMRDAHIAAILSAGEQARRALVDLLADESPQIRLGAAKALVAEIPRAVELHTALAAANPPPAKPAADQTPEEADAGLKWLFERRRHLVPPPPPPSNGNGNGNGHPHK